MRNTFIEYVLTIFLNNIFVVTKIELKIFITCVLLKNIFGNDNNCECYVQALGHITFVRTIFVIQEIGKIDH